MSAWNPPICGFFDSNIQAFTVEKVPVQECTMISPGHPDHAFLFQTFSQDPFGISLACALYLLVCGVFQISFNLFWPNKNEVGTSI